MNEGVPLTLYLHQQHTVRSPLQEQIIFSSLIRLREVNGVVLYLLFPLFLAQNIIPGHSMPQEVGH